MALTIFKNKYNLIAAFFGCWAIQLSLGITVRNPLTVVFFVLFLVIGNREQKEAKSGKRQFLKLLMSSLIAIGLTGAFYPKVAESFSSGLFKMLGMAILFVGYFLLGLLISQFFGVKEERENSRKIFDNAFSILSNRTAILIVALICFVCWLPYFLYEFPGIMTADSLVQYEQIIGKTQLSNHHPVAHTMLIGLFYKLGMAVTGDPIKSIAFYTVFQMIFMAICCGILVGHIKENKMKAIATAFFALVPFNAVFAVTLWKDVICAGITMLLICSVIDIREKISDSNVMNYILFSFLAILFALFRSNAWYALILWTPFIIYALRKELKKIVISMVVVILVVAVIKGPVMRNAGVIQPDFVESLSVPAQQIARILTSDVEISAEEMQAIEEVIDTTYIHELYVPYYADNIKELIRAGHPEVLEANKGKYFCLWLVLVSKHPVLAVKAWLQLVGGYIYPDVAYTVADMDGIMNNDLGLYWTPVIGGKLVVKAKEILLKLGDFVPLYGLLWSIGSYTWLLLIALFADIRKNKPVICKILLLLLVTTLLIASPVVDFRYGYGIVMTMPLWISGIWEKRNDDEAID